MKEFYANNIFLFTYYSATNQNPYPCYQCNEFQKSQHVAIKFIINTIYFHFTKVTSKTFNYNF